MQHERECAFGGICVEDGGSACFSPAAQSWCVRAACSGRFTSVLLKFQTSCESQVISEFKLLVIVLVNLYTR
jgi:hypothetical protein